MAKFLISLLVAALVGYFGTTWKLHRDVKEGVDMMVLMMSPYATIEYDGVSSTLTGELTVDGIRGHVRGFKDSFEIDRIGIDTPSFLSLMKLGDVQSAVMSGDDFLPEYFGVIIEGLRMPANADYGYTLHKARIDELGVDDADEAASECTGKYSLSPDVLIAMGYDEYDVSMRARFRQLGNRYAVEVETRSADMWDVDAELILVGDMMTELAKGPRYRPKLSEMRIEYTDRSMNERVVKYCKRRGLSDEEVRTAQLEAFEFMGAENGIVFDEYVMDPFIEFLDGKKTFIVTAKPNDPVTISQISLYKPEDVPALLQLSAEVR